MVASVKLIFVFVVGVVGVVVTCFFVGAGVVVVVGIVVLLVVIVVVVVFVFVVAVLGVEVTFDFVVRIVEIAAVTLMGSFDVVVVDFVFGFTEVVVAGFVEVFCVEGDSVVVDVGVVGDILGVGEIGFGVVAVNGVEVPPGVIDIGNVDVNIEVFVGFVEVVSVVVVIDFETGVGVVVVFGVALVVCVMVFFVVFVGEVAAVDFVIGFGVAIVGFVVVVGVVGECVVVDVRVGGVVGFVASVGVVGDGLVVVDVDVVVVLGFLDVVTFEILFVFNVVSNVVYVDCVEV